jgi:penicillin-binding protein 2
MQDESIKLESFTKRAFILTSGKIFLASILAFRLFDLQILKGSDMRRLAELNKNKIIWLKPLRGRILDRSGLVMADNRTEYNLALDKEYLLEQNVDSKEVFADLASILDWDHDSLDNAYHRYKATIVGKEMLVKDKLSRQELLSLEFYSYKLPGFYIDNDYERNYYYSSCTNIIGYVSSQDKNADTPDARLIKIGKTGIEKRFDSSLRGRLGYKEVEVDSRGVVKKERAVHAQENGLDLTLTISAPLQQKLHDAFAGQNGTAVIMEPDTGNILALVSVPNYDANTITDGLSNKEWQKLTSDPGLPLINKATAVVYPPGSVFKIVMALAFLESGFDPKMQVHCSGAVHLGKNRFGCWKKEGHGTLDLEAAIERSCNCYFYRMSELVGIERINKYATILGLGQKSFDDLPFVAKGLMPSSDWKRKKYKQSWTIGDSYNTSIGQGFVLTSMLQLVVMLSRVITGNKIVPTLVAKENILAKKTIENLGFSQKNLEIIRNALYKVVNSEYGTARKFKAEAYEFYGKTGTSQVASKKGRNIDFSKDDIAWELKNHGLFLGGVKQGERNICMALLVEHLGAGVKTVPIAKEILEVVLNEV